MDIGVRIPCYRRWCRRSETEAIATQAEASGFSSLWVQDHLVAPVGPPEETQVEGLSAWMDGHEKKPMTAQEYYAGDDWWLDPFIVWAFIAGITSRVRLGSDIVVVPYRNPVVQAKMLGTLDVLSNGRMILGAGSGHVRSEFDVVEGNFDARGDVHDEYLRIIVAMLTNEEVAFEGQYYSFKPVRTLIESVQRPHLPIWVGGNGPRAIRRACELGQGWLPSMVEPEALDKGVKLLHETSERLGRSTPPTMALSMPWAVRLHDPEAPPSRRPTASAAEVVSMLRQYQALGVDHISLAFPGPSAQVYLRQMELFAQYVLPEFVEGRNP
jgi:probable F420-dependent oxidoreductase